MVVCFGLPDLGLSEDLFEIGWGSSDVCWGTLRVWNSGTLGDM